MFTRHSMTASIDIRTGRKGLMGHLAIEAYHTLVQGHQNGSIFLADYVLDATLPGIDMTFFLLRSMITYPGN